MTASHFPTAGTQSPAVPAAAARSTVPAAAPATVSRVPAAVTPAQRAIPAGSRSTVPAAAPMTASHVPTVDTQAQGPVAARLRIDPGSSSRPIHAATAPARPLGAATPFVLGYYLPFGGSAASLQAHAADLSAIAPLWFGIHSDGSVQHRSGGSLQSIVSAAHRLGRKVFVLVTNMAQDRILVDPSIRQVAVQNLVRAVETNHLDGVNIDFENIDGTDAQGLVDFVAAVHRALAPQGLVTSVAVGPRAQSILPVGDMSDAYDYAALGRVSDYVVVMTYDEHGPGTAAGPIAAIGWVRTIARYAATQIPPGKILLGIAAYGYDFAQPGTPTITAQQAITAANQQGVQISWSNLYGEPHYSAPGHNVWFEDSYSAALKFRLVRQMGLGGIALWYLGAEDSGFWKAVETSLR